MSEEQKMAELHSILDATAEFLNKDELEVLIEVAQGLVRGQTIYGFMNIDDDDRDMAAEGCEELRDCLVYVGAAIQKLRRVKA